MKTALTSGIIILILTVFLTGFAFAGVSSDKPDQPKAENSKRCIELSRLKELDVVDNQTILFRMDGNKIYKNTLPYPCPMLAFERGIAYRVSMNRLCNLDVITVLDYGSTCGLSMFEPYVEDTQPEDVSG